jgi:hypothetical protein
MRLGIFCERLTVCCSPNPRLGEQRGRGEAIKSSNEVETTFLTHMTALRRAAFQAVREPQGAGRRDLANVQGRRYDHFVPEGRHMLTVSVVPNYQPTSTELNVRLGQTYVFTAIRQNTDSVVLVPSALPPGQPH